MKRRQLTVDRQLARMFELAHLLDDAGVPPKMGFANPLVGPGATGGALPIGQQTTSIFGGLAVTVPFPGNLAQQFTTPTPFATLAVVLSPLVPSGTGFFGVKVRNVTSGLGSQFQSFMLNTGGQQQVPWLFFNVPANNGDTIEIDCSANATFTANLSAIALPYAYGLDFLRPDGRLKPVGYLNANAQFNAGGTLVSAPSLPFSTLLKSVYLTVVTAGANGVGITLNGVVNNIIREDGAGAGVTLSWENGLLIDPGTSVTTAVVAGVQNSGAIYDYVL